jgi:hypothetical protein
MSVADDVRSLYDSLSRVWTGQAALCSIRHLAPGLDNGPHARMFGGQASGILDMSWKLMIPGFSNRCAKLFTTRCSV